MIVERLSNLARMAEPTAAALQMMRLSLFDWAACGIAGRNEPVARLVRDMVLAEGGQGHATLLGGVRAPCRAAALVNGAVSHALDYDDTHFAHIGHPSVAVIPAALAISEREGASGDACLRACLIGAEASIRVGTWLGRGHYQTGFHQTATAGSFGATLAAGHILGLSPDRMAHALGLVATRASGLKSQFGTMGKPFNAGLAASNGVEAACLAQCGFVSSPAALDGLQGFGPTHHGAADLTAFEGLGATWMFETVSHKFHACCHGLHAMLEAIGRMNVDAGEVSAVKIKTHPRWLTVCNIERPVTGLEAKFSYKMTAAMALLGYDTSAMADFHDGLSSNDALTSLMARVHVEADEALPETAASVRVEAGACQTISHDLDAPMGMQERTDKLRRKAAALVGSDMADQLWQAVAEPSIPMLTELMAGAPYAVGSA